MEERSITNLVEVKSNDRLKMSPDGDFFMAWVEFLKPVHKLTKREMCVLAAFLKKRYELSKAISDNALLDSILMSVETKREIREHCGISRKHIQVIMNKFRKNGVLVNNKFYSNLIPHITEEGVGLMIYFNFKNEQFVKLGPQANSKSA